MKQVIGLSLSAFLLFSVCAQPVVFAAYGGGGGGSSISKSSISVVLTRDVCPDGDKSASYYDGTCLSSTPDPTTPVQQSTEEHPTPTTLEEVVSEEELNELVTKKQDVEKENVQIKKKLSLVQKMKLTKIEKKVDTLLSKWTMMDEVTRTKKVLLLNKKIDKFLATRTEVHSLLLSVALYIQQEALALIPNQK